MENTKIFAEKLASAMEKMDGMNPVEKAGILGLQKREQRLVFDFFNRRIHLEALEFNDEGGEVVTDAVKFVFCTYLLNCPERPVESSNRLISFREFNGAGPLFSRFTANTSNIIETAFSGKIDLLKQQCIRLGGSMMQTAGYDVSARFRALHRIPIILHFNDAEEGLPASAVFLFHDNAEAYLDLECMTILTTYLTGCLIQTA